MLTYVPGQVGLLCQLLRAVGAWPLLAHVHLLLVAPEVALVSGPILAVRALVRLLARVHALVRGEQRAGAEAGAAAIEVAAKWFFLAWAVRVHVNLEYLGVAAFLAAYRALHA